MRILRGSVLFLLGLFVGWGSALMLSAHAADTFLQIVEATYAAEQNRLAACARRIENFEAALAHRRNVASLSGEESWVEDMRGVWNYLFPVHAVVLRKIARASHGERYQEGERMALLASAYDEVGLADRANHTRSGAAELLGSGVEVDEVKNLSGGHSERGTEDAA